MSDTTDKARLRGKNRSLTLLIVHLSAAVGLIAAAYLFFLFGLRFPPCWIHFFTGFYCLTCGATRAVGAFLSFDFLRSVMLNPVPIAAAIFLAVIILHEAVNAITGKNKPFRYTIPFTVALIAVAVIFCVLRNIGIIPPPNAI